MNLGLVVMQFRAFLRRLRNQESGQDLAEYCLLTGLLTLIAAGIFVYASGGIQAVWYGANTSLVAGNSISSSETGSGSAAASSSTSQPASH